MTAFNTILLIPVLPLAAFLLIALVGRRYFPRYSGIFGSLVLLVTFAIALQEAYSYFFETEKIAGSYQSFVCCRLNWLEFSPGFSIDMGLLIDANSMLMCVIVTFISLLVHIYSLGYMKGDPRVATYYSFLGLFTFSMLGLVLSCNIFQMYIFWELVGVSSFLLIGYYYTKDSAVAAAKKAFIVTRFADLGFLLGILILSYYTKTFDFQTLIGRAGDSSFMGSLAAQSFMGVSVLTWGLVLVFAGGAGKSAMFPLHIWLPDAMEGPTPVSALIHAATMVVAGVYLVLRLFPVFVFGSPAALHLVAGVGVFTALFAACIACTQTDIKRVLAYSTISQIGFMMFSLGVSGYGSEAGLGYTASMFHLFTHAIFKALLFLGAGAVIHYIHSNEMGDMGGLRKHMPITHMSFLLACLAISGIPPFAGFFSKEEILLAAWHYSPLVYGLALLTSGITAFYMFRLYYSIFWNKSRDNQSAHGQAEHHGEAPVSMLIPLVLLALLSAVAGFIPFGHLISSDGKVLESEFHVGFSVAPVLIAIGGIVFATILYKKENLKPQTITASLKGLYTSAYRKFYIDEIYLFITRKIIFQLVGRPAAWFDKTVVDGSVNGLASLTAAVSERIKGLQSGKLQDYALYFLSAVAGCILLFYYLWI
ncbi:MAG TPA: NADH-quinone oxidoreductase subunit L [Bacteroidia bacterium]|nr:NADH-quinone oxidoreductase subunit L [Bacteroidia bacterium]